MKRISIFGATGSIGQNTLDLVRSRRDEYQVVCLTGSANIAQLAADAVEFDAELAVTADFASYEDLKNALSGTSVKVAAGEAGLDEAAQMPADWVMSAIVGAAGLRPGLIAAKQGTTLALANKESLVCAGQLLLATAQEAGTKILPVDSEHSAVFQALIGEDISAVERIIITASGGAFRDWPMEKLIKATPEQAATHPNWSMGQKITIDSASLFNKALELIETREYFQIDPDLIEAVIHPESMIHALVGFSDGALMAHLGPADMRHAIGFSLNYPDRNHVPVERLDLVALGNLSFRKACEIRHPALRLAREVMAKRGLWGAAFNAAKEKAQERFLKREIGFMDMPSLVEMTLNNLDQTGALNAMPDSLDAVLTLDQIARDVAGSLEL